MNTCYLLSSLWCLFLLLFIHIPLSSGATVRDVEVKGLYSIDKKELLDLLCFKPGSPIDAIKVKQGIKRAFLKGIFDDISVETTDGDKVSVIINVKERDFVEKVYVEGNYEIPKRFIKGSFMIKEGEVMKYELIKDAIEDLRNKIAERGYPNSLINLKIERTKVLSRVILRIQVQTGEPERIKKIIVSEGPEEIKKEIRLSESDIYDKVELEKDLQRIKREYIKDGYVKANIAHYLSKDGGLVISFSTGKRLNISIEGNSVISKKELLKEMPFYEAEDFNNGLIEDSVNKMLSLYYERGYPFAQIAPVVTSDDEQINLNFFVFEGRKVKVRKIFFEGFNLLEKRLKDVMSLKEGGIYNPELIDIDKDAIEEFYHALGFLAVDIEKFHTKYNEQSHEMDINIKIQEGVKTEIVRIDLEGGKIVPEEEIRRVIGIKPGDPYNEVDISDARYRVIQLYNSRGFSDVIVTVRRDFEGQKATLTFQISEGEITYFGKTIVRGNHRTRYEVIKRESTHQDGMPFDYGLLAKERQHLYKLGLFTDVEIEPLDRYDHIKDILINVKEGNAGAVEFGLGYADYERFRSFLDISYKNLWGMNRQSSARFELSSLERRYVIQYFDPWFLNTQTPFRIFLLYEDRKEVNIDTRETRYRLTRYGATAGIEKRLSDRLKTELYYEFSNVDTFDVQPDVILSREDIETLVISSLRPGIIYDTRDNPIDPKKGIFSGISLKFATPLFMSETNFLKLLFHGSTYYQIYKGIVFALSLRGGFAWGYHETDDLPIVERFFLGGRSTVRGYEQDTLGPKGRDGNPTGGNAFLLGNLEIRSSLGKGVGIVAFLDTGNVWRRVQDTELGSLRYTAGLGLRYNTPVGPIRIDYGHKLKREKGESSGELHFSIGHAF
ncbi:MAG: outer membrane protein assembly factor BamA [Thermodesulfovibrionales bacterium]